MGLRSAISRRRAAVNTLNYYLPASMGYVPLISSGGVAKWNTFRGIYLTNPWVHSTVNKIARGVSRLPIYVYALDERGRKIRVRGDLPATVGRPTGGQSLDSLLNSGFNGQSRNAVFQRTLKERLYLGNALWRIHRDGAGMPTRFTPIRWRDLIRVEEDDDGSPLFYQARTRHGATMYTLGPQDVLHFGLGTDSETCYGVSPLEGARNTLALYDALMRHLLGYVKNNVAPSGYIQLPDGITAKRAQEIRDLTTDLYASPENAGKVLMSVGKWQGVGDAPDKAQIVELVKLSREEVLTVYDQPPDIAGATTDHPVRAAIHEWRDQWARDGLGPWATETEGDFMAQLLPLVPSWRSLRVEFHMWEYVRPDVEAMADVLDKIAPYATVNEGREMLNLPPLDEPGAESPWMKPGSVPMNAPVQTQTIPAPSQ